MRKNDVEKLFVPPGHYYSPIVNVDELTPEKYKGVHNPVPIKGVVLDYDRMFNFFRKLSLWFGSPKFPVYPDPAFRYYFDNDFYSYGDALILSAMVRELRPQKIIEIGSGFSSAVILDTLNEMDKRVSCTFIDPNPERLQMLLRPTDSDYVKVIASPVQDIDLDLFADIGANDIVFFDTTHICKTGSDVNFDIFEILPILPNGCVIHFHDVFHGFEYPYDWVISDNRSWNEIYLLRAFLMNNVKYEILLLNHSLGMVYGPQCQNISSDFMRNPGGGLWLRKLAAD